MLLGIDAPPLFQLMFLLIAGMIVVTFVRMIREWSKNNQSPRLSVTARVTGKRTRTSHQNNGTMTSTSYYATFEVESGDRMEFHVDGWEYAQLAEGDYGTLRFQGTRYLGFDRNRRV